MGFTVMPVQPNSRRLFPGRMPTSPPTEAEIRTAWTDREKGAPLNIGIRTGSRHRVVVVDIDSPDALRYAEMFFPEPLCRTTRGKPGRQRWLYRVPDDQPVPTVLKWHGLDIDILGDGGWFVAPGSVLDGDDVIEEIGPGAGVWTRVALDQLPVFDREWLKTDHIDDADVVPAGSGRARARADHPDQWKLLDAAERGFAKVRRSHQRQHGDKLTLRCPFHDDHNPSAVIFLNGNFHCKGCGLNEPPQIWTKRPEVAGMRLFDLLVPFAVTKPTASATDFRFPRLLLEVTALLRGDVASTHAQGLLKRGDGLVDGPAVLSECELRTLCAVVAYPTAIEEFAAGIVVSPVQLAESMGLSSHEAHAGVAKALKRLPTCVLNLRPFGDAPQVVAPVVQRRDGRWFLHPALATALHNNGKQWAPVPKAVLGLKHRARVVVADALRRGLDNRHRLPLRQLACGLGVWNPSRFAQRKTDYLNSWRAELAPVAHLELDGSEWVVVAGPPSPPVAAAFSPSVHVNVSGIAPSVDVNPAPSAAPVFAASVGVMVDPQNADDARETTSVGDAETSVDVDAPSKNMQEVAALHDGMREQGTPSPAAPAPATGTAPDAPTRQVFPGKRPPKAVVVAIDFGPDDQPVAQPPFVLLRGPYKRPARPS